MGKSLRGCACLLILAALSPGSDRRSNFKEEMKFAAEAAQRGLWREAIFRWEKHVKTQPDNPRLRNNIAVACESLGQFDRARREYAEARRLDPGSKEIRENLEAFEEFCRTGRKCGSDPQPPPAQGGSR
jgi:Flp pilus assembly protein TadD